MTEEARWEDEEARDKDGCAQGHVLRNEDFLKENGSREVAPWDRKRRDRGAPGGHSGEAEHIASLSQVRRIG